MAAPSCASRRVAPRPWHPAPAALLDGRQEASHKTGATPASRPSGSIHRVVSRCAAQGLRHRGFQRYCGLTNGNAFWLAAAASGASIAAAASGESAVAAAKCKTWPYCRRRCRYYHGGCGLGFAAIVYNCMNNWDITLRAASTSISLETALSRSRATLSLSRSCTSCTHGWRGSNH